MNLPALTDLTITPVWAMAMIFYLSLLVFVGHVLVLAYHWFSYNTDRKKSLLTLAVYGVGSSVCLLLMAVTLNQI